MEMKLNGNRCIFKTVDNVVLSSGGAWYSRMLLNSIRTLNHNSTQKVSNYL